MERCCEESTASKLLELASQQGIRAIVFDMDLTAVRQHSRGQLTRQSLQRFLSFTSCCFQCVVPLAVAQGLRVAIATHSDEAEFGGEVQRETHVLGFELARCVVENSFSSEIVQSVQIVAYNPKAHPDGCNSENQFKRRHFRILCESFGCGPQDILFFDDDQHVVEDCRTVCKIRAFQVNPASGFLLSDLAQALHRIDG